MYMSEPDQPNYLSEYAYLQHRSRRSPQGNYLPGKLIAALVAASLTGPALAQQSSDPSAAPIPTILVTLGLEEDENLITSPFSVLDADEVFQNSSSLGDLLDG